MFAFYRWHVDLLIFLLLFDNFQGVIVPIIGFHYSLTNHKKEIYSAFSYFGWLFVPIPI